MKSIVLIDGNPLMWRAVFSKGEAYVTHGVINYFHDIMKRFMDSEVIVFWDSGESRWRSSAYSKYKKNRDEKKKEIDLVLMGQQKDKSKEILSYFGVRSITVNGVEADDLIAIFSEFYSRILGYKVIVASRDQDLFQLINPSVVVFDPLARVMVSDSEVMADLGLPASMIPEYKALKGDTSDNIKGVKGIGEKTASQILADAGGLDKLFTEENVKLLSKKKTTARVLSGLEDLEFAYQMCKLPSLYDAWCYFDETEKGVLIEEMSKPVIRDDLRARTELSLIDPYNNTPIKYYSGLVDGYEAILQWLQDRPFNKVAALEDIDSNIHNCSKCSLYWKNSQKYPTYPIGQGSAKYMAVVRDPSKDLTSVYEVLDSLGIDRVNCWITYAVKCECSVPPELHYVEACFQILKSEMLLLMPLFVIAFGKEAMSVLTDYQENVVDHCGEIVEGLPCVGILLDPESVRLSKARKTEQDFGISNLKKFIEGKRNGLESTE